MVHLLRGKLDGLLLPQPYFSRPATPTTWNPADKDATITLSNGDLTAATSAAGIGFVRSVHGVASGKWYWELTVQSANAREIIGVSDAASANTAVLATTAASYGYQALNGDKRNNGAAAAYGLAYGNTDVISVLLNMDAGTLEFWKNGTSQGQAFTGLTGTVYAALGDTTTLFGGQVTANFGASAFAHTPPPGYKRGLGT